jgi:cytochrome P450
MEHFQPNALTISRGPDWTNRRRFNEAVLSAGKLHPFAPAFLTLVQDEVRSYRQARTNTFSWQDADNLFRHVTLQVIFGPSAREDRVLTDSLDHLLYQSNRLIALRPSRSFDNLYGRIRTYLDAPTPDSLVWLCKQTFADERTHVENQLPHWMFAMKDTLALNTVYTLALIASHPEVAARLSLEQARSPRRTAESLDQSRYLEGCVQDAMRLWPTTPMLVRQVIATDLLGGELVLPGTQVLIWNPFNHRDKAASPSADQFCPERWKSGNTNYQYNHFSNGPQLCAGKDLALFLAKAVLSELLDGETWTLRHPQLSKYKPIPSSLNPFRVAFDRRPRQSTPASPLE